MGKTAFVFPGQGAQKAGMGQAFYEQHPESTAVFEMAGKALGLDICALCFEENDKLDQTEYTQAALVTTETAILAAALKAGLRADTAAGLSLGEYTALIAADAMEAEDAIKVVRRRGILMQEAVPDGTGAMSAVLGLTGEAVQSVLEGREGVQIANYNCPGQIVISGYRDAIEQAAEPLKAAGAKRVLPLKVSGPFHSWLLTGAGRQLGTLLEAVPVCKPQIPYVTNVTAAFVTEAADIKPFLTAQVSSPVKWQQSIDTMLADGVDTFIEMGPGSTLSSFIRKINKDVNIFHIETPEDLKKIG